MPRIPKQFVPLHVEAMHDPKIAKAGPWVELLYYRALQWCAKHPETGGVVPEYAMAELGRGIRDSARRMHEACTSDLFVTHEQGWKITAWEAWNRSADEIRQKRTKAGHLGNHKQGYHKSKPQKDCPSCQKSSRKSDAHGNANAYPTCVPLGTPEAEAESGTTYHSASRPPRMDAGAPTGRPGPGDPDWQNGNFRPLDYRYDPDQPWHGGWNGGAWVEPRPWREGWGRDGQRPDQPEADAA